MSVGVVELLSRASGDAAVGSLHAVKSQLVKTPRLHHQRVVWQLVVQHLAHVILKPLRLQASAVNNLNFLLELPDVLLDHHLLHRQAGLEIIRRIRLR